MKKLLTFTALGGILLATDASASGFNLKEQSIAAMGNAFAGATAGAEDVTYSYFNPAGLTRHAGVNFAGGATWIAPRSKAKGAKGQTPVGEDYSGYTDNIVHPAAAPNMTISAQLNDNWYAAFAINSPFGMITTYDEDWAGRFHGTKSDVKTLTATPMLAYKANDKLSLGAGFQMQYVRAKLKNSAALPVAPGVYMEDRTKLEGDAFDIGYSVGALYEFTDSTRVGIGYRSQIKHKLKGEIDFASYNPMDQDIGARLTTPANLTIGAYHDLNNQWSVMAEFGRTYWSSFEELRIRGENGLDSVTEEKWKDTTFYAVGASYKYNDKWKFRAGFAVDQSAVGEGYRTPRIPDADRLWYSGGIEYTWNEQTKFNLGYTYIRAEKSKVKLDGSHTGDNARGPLCAKYENDIHMLGLGMSYQF